MSRTQRLLVKGTAHRQKRGALLLDQLNIRMTPELKVAIKVKAIESDVSLTELVARYLAAGLKADS